MSLVTNCTVYKFTVPFLLLPYLKRTQALPFKLPFTEINKKMPHKISCLLCVLEQYLTNLKKAKGEKELGKHST